MGHLLAAAKANLGHFIARVRPSPLSCSISAGGIRISLCLFCAKLQTLAQTLSFPKGTGGWLQPDGGGWLQRFKFNTLAAMGMKQEMLLLLL
jgi:hypothetical protein